MPVCIIIRGPLGIGKTTIAKRFCDESEAEYIAIDRVLEDHDLENEKEEGYIAQRSFIRANEIIAPDAKRALKRGRSVVIDGNFYWRSQIEDLIEQVSCEHLVVTLTAPLEVCIERDRTRTHPHGEDAARVVYAKTTSFTYGLVVDATQSVDAIIEEIRSHVPADR